MWNNLKAKRLSLREEDVGPGAAREHFMYLLMRNRLRLRRVINRHMGYREDVAAEALSLFESAVRPLARRTR